MRLVGLLVLPLTLCAQDPVAQGFDHFYNLEYDQAIARFEKAIEANPNEANNYNHLAQTVLYRQMMRSGALESELVSGTNPFIRRAKIEMTDPDRVKFESCLAKVMEFTSSALAKSENEPNALYSRGVAFGLRANYNFLVKKAWMDALKDATQARKLHNRLTQIEPKRADARLIEGVHDYVVGSLPWTYKMLGFLAGFRGNKETGVTTLELVSREGVKNNVDAKVLLAVVYRRERQPEKAIALLNELISRYPRNYLLRLELVQMYGDLGDKGKALAELETLEKLKRSGTAGFSTLPVEKVNYARGTVLFWYRDYDRAIAELQKVTSAANRLDLNTTTMAFLRLGQSNDMKQNRDTALAAYNQAILLAPDSDAAKQAKSFLRKPYKREN